MNVAMLFVCTAAAGISLAKGWWPEFAMNVIAIGVLIYLIESRERT
jgi:hypothetical protein